MSSPRTQFSADVPVSDDGTVTVFNDCDRAVVKSGPFSQLIPLDSEDAFMKALMRAFAAAGKWREDNAEEADRG